MSAPIPGPESTQPSQEQKKTQAVSQEDIQQHVKVQEEIEQMEKVLTIAQNMVEAQLQKAREQGKHIAFNFETIPETGDADQRANIATFNALQPQMAAQIQSLATQTAILKADDPQAAHSYDYMLSQLKDIANSFPKLSQTQANTLNGIFSFLQVKANKASPEAHAAFWQEVGSMYHNMSQATGQAQNAAQEQADRLQKANAPEDQVQGARKAASNLGSVHKSTGAASSSVGGAQSSSLPNQFQKAILHNYMPAQEQYLEELSEVLAFDNMGADIGNALLDKMTGWDNASANYDIWNNLHPTGKTHDGKTVYSGSASAEQAAISSEKNQAASDEKNLEKSINKIDKEINSIKHDHSLTKKQRNQLVHKLEGIKKEAKASLSQVQALYTLLSKLKVVPQHGGTQFFIDGPSDWDKNLPALEKIVINGATASEASQYGVKKGGGLVNVYTQTNSFQQKYSNQSQNQQMMLQMRMTEIQQEWTVVSTSLQLLNQMYMSVAQGIYQ